MPQADKSSSKPMQVKMEFRNRGELASNKPDERSTAALSDGSYEQ